MEGKKAQRSGLILKVRPFLKWAGGKTQLLSAFSDYYPVELQSKLIENYYEPFLGSGAVFFHLAQKFKFKSIHLSDANPDICALFQTVRDEPKKLIAQLKKMRVTYQAFAPDKRASYYYRIRAKFNQLATGKAATGNPKSRRHLAALLLFLNKTCYNGLFRRNSKGEFNTPVGRFANPSIFSEENILGASILLKKASIESRDFRWLMNKVKQKSFVYLDPPYKPLNKTSNFTAYTGSSFTDKDQEDLATLCSTIHRNRAYFMLSNSHLPKDGERFFLPSLYNGFSKDPVLLKARRSINSKGAKRGAIHEILIRNYT